MNEFILNKWNKLIDSQAGPFIGFVLCISAIVSSIWLICLLVAIISWPFVYIIEKILG